MRLIDADALIDFIDCGHLRNPLERCLSERDVVGMLEARPTIDAVEVGRCGQYVPIGYGHFERHNGRWRIKCVKCASGRTVTDKDPCVIRAGKERRNE